MLYRGRRESLDRSQGDMDRLAYERTHRVCCEHLIPLAYGFNVPLIGLTESWRVAVVQSGRG